ncbi:hypothetical protein [Bailinhaonella thermotolerans]|uniref:Uncharacterized protein n=1 Tax=Bailinhaonella thermotolerans TaxID=1070861 RepID=A0A3A4A1Q5_9ACTN|nr:hypothetical protein [Bailinhaonella thermotolerans]RJL21084.1 hypothetical protein D5H75_38375 [Bailinhaonella thermotolerans]
MTRRGDNEKAIKEAAAQAGLTVINAGGGWHIVHPVTGHVIAQCSNNATSRHVRNTVARIKRAAKQYQPAADATGDTPQPDSPPDRRRQEGGRQDRLQSEQWPLAALLNYAHSLGVRLSLSHDKDDVRITAPRGGDALAVAEVLRRRSDEVRAHLAALSAPAAPAAPPTPHPPDEGASPVAPPSLPAPSTVTGARQLWHVLREEARRQGDLLASTPEVSGVRWEGALKHLAHQRFPDWPPHRYNTVRTYLVDTRHLALASQYHHPHPLWVVAKEWHDTPVTLTHTSNGHGRPTPADIARLKESQPKPAAPAQAAPAPARPAATAPAAPVPVRSTSLTSRPPAPERVLEPTSVALPADPLEVIDLINAQIRAAKAEAAEAREWARECEARAAQAEDALAELRRDHQNDLQALRAERDEARAELARYQQSLSGLAALIQPADPQD